MSPPSPPRTSQRLVAWWQRLQITSFALRVLIIPLVLVGYLLFMATNLSSYAWVYVGSIVQEYTIGCGFLNAKELFNVELGSDFAAGQGNLSLLGDGLAEDGDELDWGLPCNLSPYHLRWLSYQDMVKFTLPYFEEGHAIPSDCQELTVEYTERPFQNYTYHANPPDHYDHTEYRLGPYYCEVMSDGPTNRVMNDGRTNGCDVGCWGLTMALPEGRTRSTGFRYKPFASCELFGVMSLVSYTILLGMRAYLVYGDWHSNGWVHRAKWRITKITFQFFATVITSIIPSFILLPLTTMRVIDVPGFGSTMYFEGILLQGASDPLFDPLTNISIVLGSMLAWVAGWLLIGRPWGSITSTWWYWCCTWCLPVGCVIRVFHVFISWIGTERGWADFQLWDLSLVFTFDLRIGFVVAFEFTQLFLLLATLLDIIGVGLVVVKALRKIADATEEKPPDEVHEVPGVDACEGPLPDKPGDEPPDATRIAGDSATGAQI